MSMEHGATSKGLLPLESLKQLVEVQESSNVPARFKDAKIYYNT